MHVETKEKLFKPCYTTKEKNKHTGLGPAVVHDIVSTYNGAIVIESEAAKGD